MGVVSARGDTIGVCPGVGCGCLEGTKWERSVVSQCVWSCCCLLVCVKLSGVSIVMVSPKVTACELSQPWGLCLRSDGGRLGKFGFSPASQGQRLPCKHRQDQSASDFTLLGAGLHVGAANSTHEGGPLLYRHGRGSAFTFFYHSRGDKMFWA